MKLSNKRRAANFGAAIVTAWLPVFASSAQCPAPELTASDAVQHDRFGNSVAISGDYAVVGSPYDDRGPLPPPPLTDAGAAYVFVRNGLEWVQVQKLVANDAASGDQFGRSVSIAGDVIVIGAPSDDYAVGSDVGSAYVFRNSGTTWSQTQKLVGDSSAYDNFGLAVHTDGETIVVGAPGDGSGGAAFVFRNVSGTWVQQAYLHPSSIPAGAEFGSSVAVAYNQIAVGAPREGGPGLTDAGAAYVFERSGTTWSQRLRATASDAAAGDSFGLTVALAQNQLFVGAPNRDGPNDPMHGAVYYYRYNRNPEPPFPPQWEQVQIIAQPYAEWHLFGRALSFNGSRLLVGVYSSEAYLYRELANGQFSPAGAAHSPDSGPDAVGFGMSVCMGDDYFIVGNPLIDLDGAERAGNAYIFSMDPSSESCATAIVIEPGTHFGCNSSADSLDPYGSCSEFTLNSVWYSFTAQGCRYQIDTIGSLFDTVLEIYSDCPDSDYDQPIACNNDIAPGNADSLLLLDTTEGATYYIRVAGTWAFEHGLFMLNIHEATFNVTGFDASVWPRSDAALGIAGFAIEDFENTALVAGLQIEIIGDNGSSYGPSDTLPGTFNPLTNDPNPAHVFAPGLWDGSRLLINRLGTPPIGYAGPGWGDVVFHVPGGARALGFSVQNLDLTARLSINGAYHSDLNQHVTAGSGRNGYVRVDAAPCEPIYSVRIDNGGATGNGDGIAFDHLAIDFGCPGDLNGDGAIGLSDLTILLANFGVMGQAEHDDGDLDDDQDVDLSDLTAFLAAFGTICS